MTIKKVKCIDATNTSELILGKVYEVVDYIGFNDYIVNAYLLKGLTPSYSKLRFVDVDTNDNVKNKKTMKRYKHSRKEIADRLCMLELRIHNMRAQHEQQINALLDDVIATYSLIKKENV